MKIPQHLLATAVATSAFLLGSTAFAQLPMSYQGIITTVATNHEVASGSYDMTFKLYTSPTGGTPIWQETQNGVIVNQGLFNVHLGTAVSLKLPFAEQYYLGTTIGGGEELQPRTTLTSVPYAYRATTSDSAMTVADGSITSSKLADGAVTLSKIDATGAAAGQVLMLTDTGLAWRRQMPLPQTMAAMVDHDYTLQGTGTTPNDLGIDFPLFYNNSGTPPDPINAIIWDMEQTGDEVGAGRFAITNSDNPATALVAETNGDVGGAGSFTIDNTSALGHALTASSNGDVGSTAFYVPSGAILATGNVGETPVSGSGTRMMWVPAKGAFRAGNVSSSQWDESNIGDYSVAIGHSTKASGQSSAAFGEDATASGFASMAVGSLTTASGSNSAAIGYNAQASGDESIATGFDALASGQNSMAHGYQSTASGLTATALGQYTIASGDLSTAIGYSVSTNSHEGSFVYGDASTATTLNATADNQVSMRAAGGVRFFTDASLATGLQLGTDGSFWMEGTTGSTPTSGAGTRMMWIPDKQGAFRAGIIPGSQWDASNIGLASVAMGYNTTADGDRSTAMGQSSTASGPVSTVIGQNSTASGPVSIAMGYLTNSRSAASTAMGWGTNANASASTAMGSYTSAGGAASTAMGSYTSASGTASTAMGSYASTNGMDGGFIFGDGSSGTTVINSSASNCFEVRAHNVWFGVGSAIAYSSAPPQYSYFEISTGAGTGAWLDYGGAWHVTSDRNKKTDFEALNYRTVLDRVVEMPITSWRYKGDELMRHIGPMAQDFHAAFNLSNDSLSISTLDINGVALASIKGLNEIVQEKDGEIRALRSTTEMQGAALNELRSTNEAMREQNADLRRRLERIEQLLLKRDNGESVVIDHAPSVPLK